MTLPIRLSLATLLAAVVVGLGACDRPAGEGAPANEATAPPAPIQPATGFNPDAVGDDQYRPVVGQEGQDVVWVPTPQALVDEMLRMARVTPQDVVVDLGSGDGKIPIAAARLGATARGIELNPDLVALAQRNAVRAGVADRATFVQGDIFKERWSDATVLTLYLLPELNLRLRPDILRMAPGTRVVSHAFTMDTWRPDLTRQVEGRTAYLWLVPANVGGTWRLDSPNIAPRGTELRFEQRFQDVSGSVVGPAGACPFRTAALGGPNLTFAMSDEVGMTWRAAGTVEGARIRGTMTAADGRM